MMKPNIYVISLMRSQERRALVVKEMAEKNIDFIFFDAIDGHKDVPLLAQDYDYRKRLWLTSGKMPSKGEMGCYASHYSLWLKCIELNKPIIVCEDDIKLHKDASNIIHFAIENIEKFGFLRLESIGDGEVSVPIFKNDEYTINLLKDNYGGLRAYAISPSAAARLVKHRWFFPVDCFVGANYIHGQYSYQLSPCFIASHGDFESTIQLQYNEKTSIHRKLSREIYTGYKKIMLSRMFKRKQNELNQN